jgi:hypothetical protein
MNAALHDNLSLPPVQRSMHIYPKAICFPCTFSVLAVRGCTLAPATQRCPSHRLCYEYMNVLYVYGEPPAFQIMTLGNMSRKITQLRDYRRTLRE